MIEKVIQKKGLKTLVGALLTKLHGCWWLRTELHRFLRDGLELVVASSVHVEVVLKRRVNS